MSEATTLFMIAAVFCGINLGALVLATPSAVPLSAAGRFLFGLCLTPFFLGLSFLLSSWLWPGTHKWFHIGFPLLLSSAFLVSRWRWLGSLLRSVGENQTGLDGCAERDATRNTYRWLFLFCLLPLLYPLSGLVQHIVADTRAPIVAFDALQYMRQALPLTLSGDASSLIGHEGDDEGTLRGDLHHPAWPAYLAYALQFSPIDAGDPSLDHAAGAAIQICFVLMISGLAVLMLSLHASIGWPLAVSFLLLVPQFDYVVNSFSRDAYRILPVLLLIAVLVRIRPGGILPRSHLATVAGLSALALIGHTLGGFIVVALGSAWGLWYLLGHGRVADVALGAAAMLSGLLAGGLHHFKTLTATGSFTGGALADDALRGTEYEARLQQLWNVGLPETLEIFDRVQELVMRDGIGVGVVGLGLAVSVTMVALLRSSDSRWRTLLFLALVNLSMFVQFTGLIDWFGYRVSDWFITNKRYVLHWNAVNAVFLAFSVVALGWWLVERYGKRGWVVPVLVSVLFSLGAGTVLDSVWYRNTWGREYPAELLTNVVKAQEQLGTRERLLLEDARWNWYLGNQELLLYTHPTHRLFQATSCGEFSQSLSTLRVGGVVLGQSSLGNLWKDSTLLKCLSGPGFLRVDEADATFAIYVRRRATH